MANLLSIPHELLHDIVLRLLLPDQAALAATCKLFNEKVTPTVWNEVELHHRGVHEGQIIWQLLDGDDDDDDDDEEWDELHDPVSAGNRTKKPSNRKYCQPERTRDQWHAYGKAREAKKLAGRLQPSDDESEPHATVNINRNTYQYGRGRIFLGLKGQLDPFSPRWSVLAAHVQSLCMSVAVNDVVSAVLADLVSLRSLQLVGLPLAEEWDGEFSAALAETPLSSLKFPDLRRLRLRGYFPASLVRDILTRNAPGLTHLDLGLLAGPWDDNSNAILAAEDASEPTGGEDDEEDDEEADKDEWRPWAFHSPNWLQADHLTTPLSSLTHLHLIKPYTGRTYALSFGNDFRDLPEPYDDAIYAEWAAMLDSAAGTLKELIFEHRVAMEVGDTVGDGDPHPQLMGPEAGDQRFCRILLRRLLDGGSARFPCLQRLSFRGVNIRAMEVGTVQGAGLSNEQRLRAAFPGCEIELFETAYGVYVYAGSVYQGWPENRQEAGQDAGDGLLYDSSFYNHYRSRFGPDWRVGV